MRPLLPAHWSVVAGNFVIVRQRQTGAILGTSPDLCGHPISELAARCREKGHKPLFGVRVKMKGI